MQATRLAVWGESALVRNSRKNGEGANILTATAPSGRQGRGVGGLGRPWTGADGWVPFGLRRGDGVDARIWRLGIFRPFACSSLACSDGAAQDRDKRRGVVLLGLLVYTLL